VSDHHGNDQAQAEADAQRGAEVRDDDGRESVSDERDHATGHASGGPSAQYGVGPFSIREVALVGVWLVAFIVSFFPLYGRTVEGGSVWESGIDWVLRIGVPTVAVFLIVLRRFSPDGIRRVGSLGIDQFASVAFSVAAVLWLASIWNGFLALDASPVFLGSWVIWVEFVLLTAGVVLTVFAPIIPVLKEDFRDRPEVPAHRHARPIRPITPRPAPVRPAREERDPAHDAPADAAATQDQTAVFGTLAPAGQSDTGGYGGRYGAAEQDAPYAGAATPGAGDTGAVPGYQRSGYADDAFGDAGAPAAILPDSAASDAAAPDAAAQDSAGQDSAEQDGPRYQRSSSFAGDDQETGAYPPLADDTVPSSGFAAGAASADETWTPQQTRGTYEPAEAEQPQQAYQAFWALSPVEREVLDERGLPIFRIGPTAWALVIEDRGSVYVIRHEDGRIGYLHDVSGITRG